MMLLCADANGRPYAASCFMHDITDHLDSAPEETPLDMYPDPEEELPGFDVWIALPPSSIIAESSRYPVTIPFRKSMQFPSTLLSLS